jgi:F0F1-type ATP synthase assembly protein I
MKSSIGKLTAGIGYGFLFGAAAGLTAGVVLDRLFFWTIIGVVAGLIIGIAAALIIAARSRRVQKRFEQSTEVQDEDQADTLEP